MYVNLHLSLLNHVYTIALLLTKKKYTELVSNSDIAVPLALIFLCSLSSRHKKRPQLR